MRAKIHRGPVIFAFTVVGLTACASAPPPLAELADASSQLDRARAAGASDSAPVELRFAEEKLARAREASDARDYASATVLAAQATVDAELASAKARAARARAAVRARVEDNARLRRELLGEGGAP